MRMMRIRLVRRLSAGLGLGTAAVVALTLLPAGSASAHPLGNLTQNTYAGIVVAPDRVTVDYVLDLAELPTIQAEQRIDRDGDGTPSVAEQATYRAAECTTLAAGLRLRVASKPVTLNPGTTRLAFLPGQGGLHTLRLECALAGPVGIDGTPRVSFQDTNLTDRIGWREVTLVGDGVTVSGSNVAPATISDRLLAYPKQHGAPPRDLSASATVAPGGAPLPGGARTSSAPRTPGTPQARGADPLTQWFQRTVGDRHLSVGLALIALVVAVVLGSFHALAPGHGKTMMAAYVVGRRGTTGQVLAIGLTVAVTHTGGVLALGTLIWVSQAIAPDRLLPWLTVTSGSLLAVCGLALLYRRVVLGRTGHSHLRLPGRPVPAHTHAPHDAHDHAHGRHRHDHAHPVDHALHDHAAHDHAGHDHAGHDHAGHDHAADDLASHAHAGHAGDPHDAQVEDPPPFKKAWLVLMGVAGGLVPTPSALVVLLGAMALHRTWFGVVLVALYGLGMAASLMSAGLILVRLQGWLERSWYQRPKAALVLRYLPAITALLLIGGGLSVIVRGAAQL